MTRFNSDDYDPEYANQYELWEANLQRHMKGAKGQKVLRELRDALLALPEKRLIGGRLADEQGCVCTVGALALHRRTLLGEPPEAVLKELAALIAPDERWGEIDDYESEERTIALGKSLGLKSVMAVLLAHKNDDDFHWKETPEQRYERVLAWAESAIEPELVAA